MAWRAVEQVGVPSTLAAIFGSAQRWVGGRAGGLQGGGGLPRDPGRPLQA